MVSSFVASDGVDWIGDSLQEFWTIWTTRHRASTNTRWHFAFGLCYQRNSCTDCKSAQ